VTAEASSANQRDQATIAFLQQVGRAVDGIVLADAGVHGNGPYLMLEKNSRAALAPILAWVDRRVSPGAPAIVQATTRPNTDSTALRLVNQGYFFVGTERKKVSYGTVAVGQSGVRSFIPTDVRHPYPDLAGDSKGGMYITMGGVYYVNPQGVVGRFGTIPGNGIILSKDEKTLYVTGRLMGAMPPADLKVPPARRCRMAVSSRMTFSPMGRSPTSGSWRGRAATAAPSTTRGASTRPATAAPGWSAQRAICSGSFHRRTT